MPRYKGTSFKSLILGGAESSESAEHAMAEVKTVIFSTDSESTTESFEHIKLAEKQVCSTKSECSIRIN